MPRAAVHGLVAQSMHGDRMRPMGWQGFYCSRGNGPRAPYPIKIGRYLAFFSRGVSEPQLSRASRDHSRRVSSVTSLSPRRGSPANRRSDPLDQTPPFSFSSFIIYSRFREPNRGGFSDRRGSQGTERRERACFCSIPPKRGLQKRRRCKRRNENILA